MRVLSNKDNQITFFDAASNSRLIMFHRVPNTQEIVEYNKNIYKREKNKLEINTEARIDAALNILTGIGDNCFADQDNKPISHKPDSPDFNPAWKSLLKEYAPDILILLAIQSFETSRVVPNDTEQESSEDPLSKK